MRSGRSLALLSILAAALGVVDAHAAVPAPAAARVLDARSLTKDQLASLPDAAVIETRSGRMTAGAIRAKQRANALAMRSRLESAKKTAAVQVADAVRKIESAEKARLEATNTRVRAEANKAVLLAPLAPAYSGPPEIQSAPAGIEPGSYVPIGGRGFGSLAGKVVMKGLPTGDKVLAIDSWKSTSVGVSIPSDIAGVMDQNVRLQVLKKDGTPSAERIVAFKAAREAIHLLPTSVVKCHQDATDNTCDGSAGFFGVHTEDTLWETDAVGCDEWKIPTLKNGWTIADWTVTEMSNGGGRVGGMHRPSVGDTSGHWYACWTVPGTGGFSGNGAGYMGFYVITGPKGVPYK